jgi:flotillin
MTPFLAIGFLKSGMVVFAVIGIVIVIFVFVAIWASHYTSVGPNQVLIISGRQYRYIDRDGKVHTSRFRIVKGGGTFVFPVIEKTHVLTLEPISVEFRFTEVGTSTRDRVSVSGLAQVKIKGDDISIAQAAEYFLSKGPEGIRGSATQIIESHCRKVVSAASLEEVTRNAASVSANIEEGAARELGNMGLALVSFTIRSFSQSDPVLAGTGKPPIAATIRD